MDYRRACEVLQLPAGASKPDVKQAYYKCALKHHPDKNGNTAESNERFKEITEAYAFLNREDEDVPKFMRNMFDSSAVQQLIDSLSIDVLDRLTDFVQAYKDYIPNHTALLHKIEERIKDKTIVLCFNPSFSDLCAQKIYIYKNHYFPLWHREVVYTTPDEKIIVRSTPELPEHIRIDDNNTVHIDVSDNVLNVFKNKGIMVDVFLFIPADMIKLVPSQTCLLKSGIPSIAAEETQADVFVNITLTD